tara:strand:+ start:807 stop:1130 length:324 start_codon:yes stop_codon:yes gene_type:complete
MGHDVQENQQLIINNPSHAQDHADWYADISIRKDIGFRLNKNTGKYELIAELDTWDLDVPVERFIDKVTQQYARMVIYNTVKSEGFEVEEEWEMDDNSIEVTVTRWV